MKQRHVRSAIGVALAAALLASPGFAADGDYEEDGKWFDANDDPTYNVQEDGTVDWYTFSGFRRYHAECHVCHGPDGEGSTYAPALKNSVLDMEYGDFLTVVAAGQRRVDTASESVMPAFGENLNVICFVEDLWIYLRARGDEAVARGRPAKKAAKPDAAREYEDECFGG